MVFHVWCTLSGRVRIRHMPRMTPDERINDLCLEIKGESDKHRLLQLIDQLSGVLDIREELLAKMGRQNPPSARARRGM